MKLLSFILLIAFIISFTVFESCTSKSDNIASCSVAWATELNDELSALSNAGFAYSNDPSTENCNAYKAAYQTYINALKPYGDCSALTGQNRTAFEQALQDAQDEVGSLCE